MARNPTDSVDGFLRNATHLIHDRDPLFTGAFRGILRDRGVTCLRIPAQSPTCNAYAEGFVKTARDECLRHFVFFGERHLRYVITEFMTHYHRERFHRALGGQSIQRSADEPGGVAR
ncbi:MAG: transposase [Deltaproteobacteria bacterium]|nr:transposase [Deltaproteobacteria bacterium]